jgi:hypothetical protein
MGIVEENNRQIGSNEFVLGWEHGMLGVFVGAHNNTFERVITVDCATTIPGHERIVDILRELCHAFNIRRAIDGRGGLCDVEELLKSFTNEEKRYSVTFAHNGITLEVGVACKTENSQEIVGEAVSRLYNEMGISLNAESIANALIVEKSDAGS